MYVTPPPPKQSVICHGCVHLTTTKKKKTQAAMPQSQVICLPAKHFSFAGKKRASFDRYPLIDTSYSPFVKI